jgi:hypothetical protein
MNSKSKHKIVVTHISLTYYFYFQWLILGLYQLQDLGEIKFRIRLRNPIQLLLARNYRIFLGLRKYGRLFRNNYRKDYILKGHLIKGDNKVSFCYDIADSPFIFNRNCLQAVDCYFKAQCPIKIDENGFSIANEVIIKFSDFVLQNRAKIFPSMLGPSCRSFNILTKTSLFKGYTSMHSEQEEKTGKLMCYFGSAIGPKPDLSFNGQNYLTDESKLLGYFNGKVTHPNEKRAIAAEIIASLGEKYDARVINNGIFDNEGKPVNQHLHIPLADYTAYIAKFEYNLNISGFRMSIPNRFIYSFIVGTAILTDKLMVKWYRPFDSEVKETVFMGYNLIEDVDWESFKNDLKNLPHSDGDYIRQLFKAKWAPLPFARYLVETCQLKMIDKFHS